MSTTTRIAGFLLGLVALFGVAFGTGRVVGPFETPVASDEHASDEHVDDEETAPAADAVGGLSATEAGYTLRLADRTPDAGPRQRVAFTIDRSNGDPLLDYDVEHEKRLHLIAVRRDLTGFQHVHPTLDRRSGEWSARLALDPGAWRVYADFQPADWDPLTLGDDLLVGGAFEPRDLPRESRSDRVDGYRVTLAGDDAPGTDTRLTLSVTKDGRPVTDLQPYLGAYGHLIAIRAGDLGYLHVHPEDGPAGPEIGFHTRFPSAGTYGLFLDFRHGGAVRTAEFALHPGGHVHGVDDDHGSADGSEHEEGEHDH